ncbi:thiamine ABC transporter ATP-binding protein [Phyllobacterium salinisoli]|uniref:Thiamine ABC transporter ATP-binding protein n=1 Tax=Phyllobacterium salinisoli TaxID=1899321 RepID=A0A368K6J4_9HYPH|nr:thiamine ABC transporter ATP-binding protein [Phyllobacterium salinisoli]RCS23660.1 thiamine ABC transporter ATP-binding protein [Phyllobacterium salinisoli]
MTDKTGGAKVALEEVRFSYGEMRMHFDLSVPAAQIAAIIGPSGSGKSTLLNLIAGFETPQSGTIHIGHMNVTRTPPAERPVSMVFQENNLFAHLDVEANIALGRSPKLKLTAADRAAVESAIARVGLAGKEKRKPQALSGGEKQRVAIARALVRNRPVLLLDEAFASLGPALRIQMLDLIKALHAETAMTVLMVTHHPEDALHLDAALIFLENGVVAASGSASDLLSDKGPEALKRYMGTTA